MIHSFSDDAVLAQYAPSYANWLGELRKLFEVADEFLLAEAIYPFMEDWEHGLPPRQSYDRFDEWARSHD